MNKKEIIKEYLKERIEELRIIIDKYEEEYKYITGTIYDYSFSYNYKKIIEQDFLNKDFNEEEAFTFIKEICEKEGTNIYQLLYEVEDKVGYRVENKIELARYIYLIRVNENDRKVIKKIIPYYGDMILLINEYNKIEESEEKNNEA